MWPFGRKKLTEDEQPRALEAKLAALATCGIALKPAFTAEDLLSSWDRAVYERKGFGMLLVGLGMCQEQPPHEHRSENLWHFDTECIEDHGSYVQIAGRMVEMAQGSLPLTDIEDYVDIDQGEAWLSYKLRGESFKIPCEVQDDWVDPAIFSHFVELLARTDPSKLYIYYNTSGQDCILGCVTRDDFAKLKKLIPKVELLA